MAPTPSIHATCVLAGATAVLIRGPSGSGKSRLAWQLLQAAEHGVLPFARLICDDRTCVEAANGRLLARPAASLSGLLELRHVGIQALPAEPVAVVGLVVDLHGDAPRLPDPTEQAMEIEGIQLPRLIVPALTEALPLVLARLVELRAARERAIATPAFSEK